MTFLVRKLMKMGMQGCAVGHDQESALVILSHHQVHFDIPYALPELNNSGSVLYGDSTGDNTPRIAPEASLTPSMPMTKVLAFSRLAPSISGAITTCCGASSSRIAPKFPADGRRMYPDLLGDFFLIPTRLEEGLNLITLFKTELGLVFFHVQCKDCTARSNGIKGPQRSFCRLFS